MKLTKKINWKHSRWDEILPNDNKHMRKAGYDLILRRQATYSLLKKGGGQMVGGIDAKSSELIAKYPKLSELIKEITK